jgi:hypothetical protein
LSITLSSPGNRCTSGARNAGFGGGAGVEGGTAVVRGRCGGAGVRAGGRALGTAVHAAISGMSPSATLRHNLTIRAPECRAAIAKSIGPPTPLLGRATIRG